MKYLVIFTQEGEGCDYTIGCGVATRIFDANTVAELESAIGEDLFGDNPYYSAEMAEVQYVPLETVCTADLAALQKPFDDEAQRAEQQETEARERAEFQRLQAKYGRNP